MKRGLIVTGGSTDKEFGQNYIKENAFDLMIAADSGMHFFYETGYYPDRIIGDFDSVHEKTLRYFQTQEGIEWVRLIPEKDDTDTEAAIRLAIAAGCDEIHILGGTGSRIDHMLGNIGLLGIGLTEHVSMFLVDPQNRVRMIRENLLLSKREQYGDFVSLLAVTSEVTGVTLTGMKYPLKDDTMHRYSSLGISNEIVEDVAEIRLENGVLLVIESLEKPC